MNTRADLHHRKIRLSREEKEKELERLEKLRAHVIGKTVNCKIDGVGDFSAVILGVNKKKVCFEAEVEEVAEFVPLKPGEIVSIRPSECLGRVN